MASNRPLPGDLTVTGMDQASMYAWMANVTDLLNELKADHDTNQTHLTNMKTLVNNTRTYLTGDRLFSGNPALAISSNFDVKTGGACVVSIDGVLKNVAVSAACDTGTAETIPAGKWNVFLVSASVSGALASTWGAASAAYTTEALAIAALPAAPASRAPVGYVTVKAHATAGFTAGTDALKTGIGGTVAAETNYYNLADPAVTVSAAVSTSSEAALANSTDITLSRS